ncbi:helix-turn-helix domain-containing protein [Chitinophaga lutea]
MEKKSLKEHRTIRHLSQQELADRAGVSLRTVQRMEKGASAGSLFVIRALCAALDIEMEGLVLETEAREETPQANPEEMQVKKYLKYFNFSALLVLLCPFANLVTLPALYLVLKKKLTNPVDKTTALKILSFQIIWSALTLTLLVFTPLVDYCFFRIGEILDVPLFIWVYLALLCSHLLTTLTAAARLNRNQEPMPFVPNIM